MYFVLFVFPTEPTVLRQDNSRHLTETSPDCRAYYSTTIQQQITPSIRFTFAAKLTEGRYNIYLVPLKILIGIDPGMLLYIEFEIMPFSISGKLSLRGDKYK